MIVGQHEPLTVIRREDQHLVVLAYERGVNRHVQHDVGRAIPQVVPLPNHVAQVARHAVVVGIERQQRGRQPHLLAECVRQRNVDARELAANVV